MAWNTFFSEILKHLVNDDCHYRVIVVYLHVCLMSYLVLKLFEVRIRLNFLHLNFFNPMPNKLLISFSHFAHIILFIIILIRYQKVFYFLPLSLIQSLHLWQKAFSSENSLKIMDYSNLIMHCKPNLALVFKIERQQKDISSCIKHNILINYFQI